MMWPLWNVQIVQLTISLIKRKQSLDIVILDDLATSAENVNAEKKTAGMDEMYNERLQKRIESLKRAVGRLSFNDLTCRSAIELLLNSCDLAPCITPENERHSHLRHSS